MSAAGPQNLAVKNSTKTMLIKQVIKAGDFSGCGLKRPAFFIMNKKKTSKSKTAGFFYYELKKNKKIARWHEMASKQMIQLMILEY